jgi:predicted Zn-dependent protease
VRRIVLEVGYAPGAEPDFGTGVGMSTPWQLVTGNLNRLFQGTGKTLVIPTSAAQTESVGAVNGMDFTASQILAIVAPHRQADTSDTAVVYAVWLPGYFNDGATRRMDVLGVSIGTTGVVAMFKPVISASAMLPNVRRFVEQTTLIHEFGHVAGLVNNGVATTSAHHDSAHGAHCTNADCVMYWQNEGVSDLVSFVTRRNLMGTETLFGAECLADAAQAAR